MSKIEFVKFASDEQKHAQDVESVKVHGDKIYSGDDEGKVKYKKPTMLAMLPKADIETVIVHEGRVMTGDDNGLVKVWDHDLNLVHELKAHPYAVNDILIVENSMYTACADCIIKVWDLATFELKKTIEGHNESVRKIKTDGKNVFAGDDSGEVRVYTMDGEFDKVYGLVEEVWDLHAQGNRFFTVRDRGLTIIETKDESNKFTVVNSTPEGRSPLYVTPDILAFADRSGMTVLVHDNIPGSHQLKAQLQGHDRIITALGGKGNLMVSAGWDNKVKLWDMTSFKEIGSCDVPNCTNGLAMTEDNLVFAGGFGGFIAKMKVS